MSSYSVLSKENADEGYLEKILKFRGGVEKEGVVIIPTEYASDLLRISKERDWGMRKIYTKSNYLI